MRLYIFLNGWIKSDSPLTPEEIHQGEELYGKFIGLDLNGKFIKEGD